MSKPLILVRADCLDGSAALYAAWCKFGDDGAEYRPVRHGQSAPTDVGGRDVFLLDFCYPRAVLAAWSGPESITVLDHHRTIAEDFSDLLADGDFSGQNSVGTSLRMTVDQAHSGAVLAWRHFHPETAVPEVLRYVEDGDLWKFELPHSRAVRAALESYGAREDWRVFQSFQTFTVRDRGPSEILTEGRAILRVKDQQVAFVASTAEVVRLIGGECFLAACSAVHQSEVGAALAAASRDRGLFPMGAVWFRDGRTGKFQVSLRSVDGHDVSEIAKRYGGGGHVAAAGFQCEVLPWR